MNICGFEGSGTLIAIGVSIILTGIVTYYCSARLGEMEKTITKQNQIISDFLGSVQHTLTDEGPGANAAPGANPAGILLGSSHGGLVVEPADPSDSGSDSDTESVIHADGDDGATVRVVSLESEEDTGEVSVDPNAIPSKVGEMRDMALRLGLVADAAAAKALRKADLVTMLNSYKEGGDDRGGTDGVEGGTPI